jgi:hypothetical protein
MPNQLGTANRSTPPNAGRGQLPAKIAETSSNLWPGAYRFFMHLVREMNGCGTRKLHPLFSSHWQLQIDLSRR